jgi:hypothetical protein
MIDETTVETDMLEFFRKLRLTHWSTYGGFVIWGASGFMAAPTLASLAYHMFILPLVILATVKLAQHGH